jgi:hypothetical protein
MDFDLYDFYRNIKAKRIIFCYSGPIAHVGLEGIAQTLRRNLEMDEAGNGAVQAVFSVFVEQMQNVLNYSTEPSELDPDPDHALKMGIVAVGLDGEGYFIYCGNRIGNADMGRIREKIEGIRNLSKEELKLLYRERRRQAPEPGSKGAGLGLIEMARKAGKPIDYSFAPIDEDSSFFSLKVVVCREGGR